MFNLASLEEVRDEMITEIKSDMDGRKLYISDRLNEEGKRRYPSLLLEAARTGNIESFINSLGMQYFNTHYLRKKPKGGYTEAKMPHNANITLCEGEFNRFYIRAVCVKALRTGQKFVTAYRARSSTNPRPESIAIEGKQFDAEELLLDLRENIGVDTALGLPPGPNSGMSVKL
ncbi:MAG: hypothetical protein ISS28_03315 [Candidatus Cloacimonetes bacterium]|nr:hypothetical protein [Candidatus Cloacimonadota bacterium]